MRSVLVTGAAGGIGSHTARLLHARGWLVGCYDRDAVGAKELASSLGAGAIGGRLDVTADDEWQAALAEVSTAAGGGLHALVNNAGILASGLLVEMPMLDHERQVAINLLGVITGARAAHPLLAATPGSVLVNVASASPVHGQPGLATYAATKAAVRSLTEALSLEWQGQVRVVDVLPMWVRTPLLAGAGGNAQLRHLGVRLTPDQVAAAIVRAVETPDRLKGPHRYVGGQARFFSLATRLAPPTVSRTVVRLLAHR